MESDSERHPRERGHNSGSNYQIRDRCMCLIGLRVGHIAGFKLAEVKQQVQDPGHDSKHVGPKGMTVVNYSKTVRMMD